MQLVIELPPRDEQMAFNRQRWNELCADSQLAKWPGKIETNAHGKILMTPPPGGPHSHKTYLILITLHDLLGGLALPECPVSTIDGVRAADVGWYSEERFARVEGQIAFEIAPEICVEVLSPANTPGEMREKRRLYFEAGAEEVWLCHEDGSLHFFTDPDTEHPAPTSTHCPEFPASVT